MKVLFSTPRYVQVVTKFITIGMQFTEVNGMNEVYMMVLKFRSRLKELISLIQH